MVVILYLVTDGVIITAAIIGAVILSRYTRLLKQPVAGLTPMEVFNSGIHQILYVEKVAPQLHFYKRVRFFLDLRNFGKMLIGFFFGVFAILWSQSSLGEALCDPTVYWLIQIILCLDMIILYSRMRHYRRLGEYFQQTPEVFFPHDWHIGSVFTAAYQLQLAKYTKELLWLIVVIWVVFSVVLMPRW